MGVSIRENDRGKWTLYIRYHGLRKSKQVDTLEEAEAVKARLEAMMLLGQFSLKDTENKNQTPTFKQIADEWLANHVSRLSHSTQQRYRHILIKYAIPSLGKKPIDEIKRSTIMLYLEKLLNKGLSVGSVSLIKDVISGVMERAIDLEIITSNPTRKVMGKMIQAHGREEKDVEVFTADEVEHILLTCKKRYPGYYPLFLCAFRTGMRLGELLGLNWQDINWNDKYIRVQRSYKNQMLSPTKNKQNRNVDMSTQLKTELRKLYQAEKKAALKEGREVEQPIFKSRGKRLPQNSVRNVWKRLLDKSGYDYRKFHSTRHTFASLLISANIPLVAVKEQMGHHSIKITVDTYGKFIKSGEGITEILDNKVASNGISEKGKVSNS